jgi:hypothetical protein
MWHKVKWLTFWVSMVLWFGGILGCASPGDEQNYKATQPERPDKLERYYDSQRTVPVDELSSDRVVYVADGDVPAADAKPVDAKPADTKPIEERPADAKTVDGKPVDATAVVPGDAPSLTKGLDRSHWPRIRTGPDIGRTYHGPLYYEDLPADRPEPQVNFRDAIEKQLESALSGTKDAGLFDGHHALQLISQPAKFAFDTLAAPFRMLGTPPWALVTTP